MRTWILFSASIIAMALRPEMNSVVTFGKANAVVWFGLLVIGLILDIREHLERTGKRT